MKSFGSHLFRLGLTGWLAALTAGACSGKDKSGNDATGGSSSGGASNGGSSSGSGESGMSGDSSGGAGGTSGNTGGSSGADPTGGGAGEAGADSGGSSSGAMGGVSGTAGAGMGGSAQGGSGQGGGGTAGMTGTLGDPCSPRGALACSGNYQKLTVLCGAEDIWEPNLTCGADQFCDSTPGPNVGTCRPVAPGCEDGPGANWCDEDDKTLVTCGPDAVTTLNMACPRACHNGECRDDVGDCPVWDDYEVGVACSSDCGTTPNSCIIPDGTDCMYTGTAGFPALIRTSWADETCTIGECPSVVLEVRIDTGFVRVTASSPWRIGGCDASTPQCIVLTESERVLVSAPANSGPANIMLEEFETEPACPQ